MSIGYWVALGSLAGAMLACTNQQSNDTATATEVKTTSQPVIDSANTPASRNYRDGVGLIRVMYQSDGEILAMRIRGADTSRVNLRGDFQPDGVIGCDSCLLVNNGGAYTQGGGYAVNDSLFLLTVAGSNWRALLFGINFNRKALLTTSGALANDHLETYLDAFVYNAQTKLIRASDSFSETDEQRKSSNVAIHTYALTATNFVHKGRADVPVPADIRDNPAAMMRLMKQLAEQQVP